MKLVHPDYTFKINCNESNINLLVIENPETFRSFVFDFLRQSRGEDGLFVLSNKDGILDIKNNIDILLNPIEFEDVPKKVSSKVLTKFKEYLLDENNYIRTQEIISSIEKYADQMTSEFMFPVTYDDITVESIMKGISVSIKTEYESPLERISEYMNLMHDVLGIGIFVITNLFSYFSNDEISFFLENCELQKHTLILCESHDIKNDFPNLKKIIIDWENCEIY